MGNAVEAIDRNKNLISSVSQPLAVIGLDKIGKKVAGKFLTPAVWALNYAVNGKKPDNVDLGLYGVGLMGGSAGPAAIATGIVKAAVDDDMEHRLKIARLSEDVKYRPTIFPCYHYGTAPPQINAMTIASSGGTAWQHPNGLWVYILFNNGKELLHVPNFKPNKAIQVYQPVWPLQPKGEGRFVFTINR
jgi:hypothetical protein